MAIFKMAPLGNLPLSLSSESFVEREEVRPQKGDVPVERANGLAKFLFSFGTVDHFRKIGLPLEKPAENSGFPPAKQFRRDVSRRNFKLEISSNQIRFFELVTVSHRQSSNWTNGADAANTSPCGPRQAARRDFRPKLRWRARPFPGPQTEVAGRPSLPSLNVDHVELPSRSVMPVKGRETPLPTKWSQAGGRARNSTHSEMGHSGRARHFKNQQEPSK